MENWQAFVLGIVEGITEFLPISSTGHLTLAGKLIGVEESDFSKTFKIFIQLGAILSVVVLYWRILLKNVKLAPRLLAAFVPTGILGFTLYKRVRANLENEYVVLISLAVGGLILIVFEVMHRKEDETDNRGPQDIPYWMCVVIGFCQAIAMVPGVSRSAATILGGLALGLRRQTIVEFSFLLAVPTMLAATVYDLYKNAPSFSGNQYQLLAIGFLVSFVVALVSIRLLLRYIKTHTFIPFGIYRILLAVTLYFVLIRPAS